MQLKSLKLNTCIAHLVLLLLVSCIGKVKNNDSNTDNSNFNVQNNIEFNGQDYLKEINGTWICYKYEKDTINGVHSNFEFDELYAEEFFKTFWFEIEDDTLVANNTYKMPIQSTVVDFDSINMYKQKKLLYYANAVKLIPSPKQFRKIEGKGGQTYDSYSKVKLKNEITIPFLENYIPISSEKWCFSDIIIMNYYGYIFYMKKGNPFDNSLIGITGDIGNRFEVNRTYSDCTIKEAAYKLIEEFPKGTMGLLFFSDEPNENGEMETWFPEKSGFNYGESTECIWKDQNNVTIKVFKHKNCLFVFEFEKQENDVHVKYWNDVVFPFEEGYKGN